VAVVGERAAGARVAAGADAVVIATVIVTAARVGPTPTAAACP